MFNVIDACDACTEILNRTHEGDDLAPRDLTIVEMAANGFLNEAGQAEFDRLLVNVRRSEGYQQPWLHGVEHLTKDHNGFVFWRGIEVEQYSIRDFKQERVAATQLGETCRRLEELGITVSSRTVSRAGMGPLCPDCGTIVDPEFYFSERK